MPILRSAHFHSRDPATDSPLPGAMRDAPTSAQAQAPLLPSTSLMSDELPHLLSGHRTLQQPFGISDWGSREHLAKHRVDHPGPQASLPSVNNLGDSGLPVAFEAHRIVVEPRTLGG